MNKERRDSIRLIIQNIEDAVSGLEEILEEEEQSRDNIPENLQNSAVYEKAEEACDRVEYGDRRSERLCRQFEKPDR